MKNKIIYILTVFFLSGFTFTSCTDYLDRDSDSVLSEEDAFKNFNNFQGFVEVMYNVIPDIAKHNWVSSFNWGDDEVITTGNGEYLMGYAIDGGNYRSYINKGDCFLDRPWAVGQRPNSSGERFDKALWGGSWYAIRQANIGLEALQKGLLKDATQEERNFIEGQLYFFRAWFYFQLTTYWGGLPYIESVLASDAQFNLPRESYQENAEKMAADFQRAADLLPIDWDNTPAGSRTKGNNAFRPNKIWALSYLGKCLLYAGSPLMQNGGENDNRSYNADYCKRAADALGKVLTMVEGGQTQYALVSFDKYSTLFYTKEQNWLMPGGTEAIMRSPTYGADSYWRQMNSYQLSYICDGDGIILCPAANYVNYFGMANGLPLNDSNSGFSKSQPWKDRDPRFYNNFIYDGVKMIKAPSDERKVYQYANLYEGGNSSDSPSKTSRTGYFNYKFIPLGANKDDSDYGYGKATHLHLSWLRLAEVYLLYAEAAAQGYGSPTGKSSTFTKNAIEAVNVIRERAGVSGVADSYTSDLEKFMGEVRRERAVELAYEGHRFNDLRRWKLLTVYPYNIKTTQKFDRAEAFNPETSPQERKVVNFREEIVTQRNLSGKHYWLPFKTDDVTMYPEFNQNPGW
ncbi:RagB/SusD family nutrient uptake outer membrane protein [Bacteroides graminisolvens]|uniref:RagB/SusD family nutrient uptake outer membrane protein n=1 Tax=Bacteroides graminisolvens TaxID=477666 RepID=UPI0023F248ED|nr:RagB/SusD family nutrient uptake outer membrane protein [Bacteroides graminisolvens]MDD3210209.1 RagB/SusD family nutrient uptake outer membrane protein [Bacteroides graminisolvens]